MGIWSDWRRYLLQPMLDAALVRSADSSAFQRHARSFPGVMEAARHAAENAAHAGFRVDPKWVPRFTFGIAFDRQDVFCRLLGRSLITLKRLEVRGRWPEGKFMALGLHWGAGFPVLEHLQASGREPAFVYRPENPAAFANLPQRLKNRLHMRALNSFGRCIPVGGAYRKIAAALLEDRVPVALFDAPAEAGSQVLRVDLSGYRVTLRRGLFRLLARQNVPFVFYRCGLNALGDGAARVLTVGEALRCDDEQEIAHMAAAFLLDTLRHDAAQWHFWPGVESIIELAEQ